MEKKLKAYYQNCVRPVEKWGPFYEKQYMMDGTDVDVIINRKRAHKIILSEAFSNTNKLSKFKKRVGVSTQAANKNKSDE